MDNHNVIIVELLEEYIVDLQQEKKQLEELLDKIKYETECLKNSFDDEDEVFEDFERIINLFPKGDE